MDNYIKNFLQSSYIKDLMLSKRIISLYYAGTELNSLIEFIRKCDIRINRIIQSFDEVKSCNDFLVIFNRGMDYKLIDLLDSMDKKEGNDYVYVYHDITISHLEGLYRDNWSNSIKSKSNILCKVRFKGWDSELIVGKQVMCMKGGEINVGSHCRIVIEDNCIFNGNISIRCEDNSSIYLAKNCKFKNSELVSRNKLVIGENFRSNDGLQIYAEENTEVNIGNNCLFSSDIHIRSGNGHSLIDLDENRNLSNKDKKVEICNHVWVGQDTTIFPNTLICDNCVIGAKSFVKGSFPRNSLLYGIPARVHRSNVMWDYENGLLYEKESE